ncbi:semialdehyde dehydrogenase [Salmonella enterica subsp. enterica]|uniref:Semialdehyde dehydrogenase n=1 Tax=Salmonella enterica I TaxID=59201 RepID=A0A447TYW9_SALET|nr:semialdehyde dehydrogenase [Salmonella enterica subsp. enterica]
MVSFEALRPLAAEEAREAFSRGEDIVLSEETDLPDARWATLPAIHSSLLAVCIMITVCRNKFQFWSVADNVRFGGALMAVKIAEKLVQGVSVLMSGQPIIGGL